jgi:hypothetical protein
MQGFRHRAGLAEGGDEIYITEPTRQNVHVEVSSDSGTGGFAKVHADVEAIGVIDLLESSLRSLGQVHHLVGDLFVGFVEIRNVLKRQDHQMACTVRINIEDDKIKLGASEDEFFLIACRVVQDIAENAAARLCGAASCYVVISPWAPQNIHAF